MFAAGVVGGVPVVVPMLVGALVNTLALVLLRPLVLVVGRLDTILAMSLA